MSKIWEFKVPMIIGVIILMSFLYLKFVFNLISDASAAECVVAKGQVVRSILGLGNISIKCTTLGANEVGDYFAGLVSLLATFWLIIAFVWQAMELAFQRREFRKTNEIAISRVANEDIWRKIEFYDIICKKLQSGVCDKLRLVSKFSTAANMSTSPSLPEILRFAETEISIYEEVAFDRGMRDEFVELQSVHEACLMKMAALASLEEDPALSPYLALFD